jgi:hypothetical protein
MLKTSIFCLTICILVLIGKFKENIIFVTFSKTPMLKTIVERIHEHCGYPVPEFQSDEDAVNRLGLLLKKVEGSPLFLVLDDVWPSSESLVEKFQFQISNFKILVTSRVAFPRFSTTCILKPLAYEDAVTLFHHYAQMEKNSSDIIDKNLVEKVLVLTFLHISERYLLCSINTLQIEVK